MKVQGIATSDIQGLNELKYQAKQDANKALPEVAKQFEGIFLQTMLKTMRMGQHFLDDSSPFSSQNQGTFQEMLDGQYASSIAGSKGVGLASMLAKQLQHNVSKNPIEGQEVKPTQPIQSANTIHDNDKKQAPSVDDFVKSIWPFAKEAASAIGLDPKILVAQAALETGWGKFIAKDSDGSTSNNLFNIKASKQSSQDSVTIQTTEYVADTPIKMNASFRKYPTVENSFHDYVSLIKGSERYQSALAHANNPEMYVHELGKAGYATDPNYGSKILSIYNGDELHEAIERCGLSDRI